MAAKPPKPPGNFLKCLLTQHNNNKNQQQQHNNNEDIDNIEGNNSEQQFITNNATATSATTAINSIDCNTNSTAIATAGNKKQNCNCSNISIMHLFHEMKQEFPTIPDTIVAQCVNENCHQRENCIQMLRNELELNPIPAQSYPAKVLHPPNCNNSNNNTTATGQKPPLQQKPLVVQQKPPLKPIKPIRTAPLQPPATTCQNSNNNCNSTLAKNTNTTTNKPLVGENIENIVNGDNVCTRGGEIRGDVNVANDMPSKITPQSTTITATTNTVNSTTNEVNNNTNTNNVCLGIEGESIERILPRQRPTTLNLNSQLKKQQQEQRQRLNVQLQQRFQEQRNRQQQPQPQLQPQQQQNPIISTTTKPLRKAPLPPIAPKPSSNQFHINHTNANSFINDSSSLSSNHTTTSSPLSESEISVSVSLSTPSPTSPNNNNTTIHHHHPFNTPKTQQQQQHLQTKSPIVRHRSVITLQPEPPYTRDFLYTPAASTTTTPSSPSLAAPPSTAIQTTATNSSSSATSSPTTSVSGSQKSFTSVNLTLRPPVSPTGANSALQPSTIDITAGPGFSGASGGGKSLHYSSTSYDARLGYQQNFQITVTDEGGIFSACRLRPKQQQQPQHERGLNHQQQLQLQQQFHNNNVVALQQNIQNQIQSPNNHQHGIGGVNTSSGFGGSGGISGNISGNMCLPPQQAMDGPTQKILQCQKQKRDKLANALRDYKKRLSNVEQEINLLTGTIPTQGLSERLDEEINKLRRDCQDMLRSSNPLTQQPLQQELAIDHQPQQWQTQQQPQPFQRQRMTRPPPRPPPPRQTSLDIIQHHSQTSTPHTPPAGSLPNLNCYNTPQQQQQQNHHNSSLAIPSYNHQQSAPLYTPQSYTDHSNFVNQEPVVDDSEDEYEEVIEQPWACSMCTFRNHPQLNICEACDNVRISGRITNLPRALSATNFTNIARGARSPAGAVTPNSGSSPNLGLLRTPAGSSNNLNSSNSGSRNGLNAANANSEHDTNLVQQQLQHYALHT